MKKTYKDELAAEIHAMASGLYEAGLMPQSTMREIDQLCLTPVKPLSPVEIKAIRENAHASQAVSDNPSNTLFCRRVLFGWTCYTF